MLLLLIYSIFHAQGRGGNGAPPACLDRNKKWIVYEAFPSKILYHALSSLLTDLN